MKIFISTLNVPIGYQTPRFPSLYWPLGATSSSFQRLYLYYSGDIWRYTVYWALILFAGLYLVVGILAMMNGLLHRYRHGMKIFRYTVVGKIVLIFAYVAIGMAQGFLCGAIIGLILQAIYKAGSLSMSTWIPFCWAIAMVLFNVATLYHNFLFSL